jgi:hypothetical protein
VKVSAQASKQAEPERSVVASVRLRRAIGKTSRAIAALDKQPNNPNAQVGIGAAKRPRSLILVKGRKRLGEKRSSPWRSFALERAPVPGRAVARKTR